MRAAIALGSNLLSRFGDPLANLGEALNRLNDLGQITATSTFVQTDPVGYTDQPRFTNGAALLHTHLSPLDLLHGLLAIERAMGRQRADLPSKGPRTLDLDLLLYEDERGHSLILKDPGLTLPHPEMHRRSFVLDPLAEIAPDLLHPILHRTVRDLAHDLATAQ